VGDLRRWRSPTDVSEERRRRPVSLRLDPWIVEQAKEEAKEKGLPYQALLREIAARSLRGADVGKMLDKQYGSEERVRVVRMPREDGWLYVLPARCRRLLEARLAGVGLTIPASCFVGYETYSNFGVMYGLPFEGQVPAVFHVSETLGLPCAVVDGVTGKTLWPRKGRGR